MGSIGAASVPARAQAGHAVRVHSDLKLVLDGDRQSADDFMSAREVRNGEERIAVIARNPIAIATKDERDQRSPERPPYVQPSSPPASSRASPYSGSSRAVSWFR